MPSANPTYLHIAATAIACFVNLVVAAVPVSARRRGSMEKNTHTALFCQAQGQAPPVILRGGRLFEL